MSSLQLLQHEGARTTAPSLSRGTETMGFSIIFLGGYRERTKSCTAAYSPASDDVPMTVAGKQVKITL